MKELARQELLLVTGGTDTGESMPVDPADYPVDPITLPELELL